VYPTQPDVDALVDRIKTLTAKCGPKSPALEPVRMAYAVFHGRQEPAAFVALEGAVETAERGFAPA